MYISDDEKDGRKEALAKLLQVMGKGAGDKLAELKKPVVASIEVDKMAPDGQDDQDDSDMPSMPSDNDGDESAPSDDEKAQISYLYNKYCK